MARNAQLATWLQAAEKTLIAAVNIMAVRRASNIFPIRRNGHNRPTHGIDGADHRMCLESPGLLMAGITEIELIMRQ
jgi:hypothetical protein